MTINNRFRDHVSRFSRNRSNVAFDGVLSESNKSLKLPLFLSAAIIYVLLIQQGAFVDMPAFSPAGVSLEDSNFLNTIGVISSSAIMGILLIGRARELALLASRNVVAILYMLLVLISVAWSIHPDLTIRRGLGYVLSLSIAAYLTIAFNDVERTKLISASFAVSAVGSLLYVAAFPHDGIMQVADLVGDWRGVFPHKNVLGPIMALAIFTELYVLTMTGGRPAWRSFLLILYFALLVLTRSATALISSVGYVAGTFVYVVWKRDRLLAAVLGIIILLLVLAGATILWAAPDFTLGLIGKDTGLTGRTELWEGVLHLIYDRPYLGYGYRSMWGTEDAYRILMDQLTGGWGVTHAHNTMLEITLELGALGAFVILIFIALTIWRGYRCCERGILPLGFFTLLFVAGTILTGQTEMTAGWNQNMGWLIFNVLSFSCGQSIFLTYMKWVGHRNLSV